MAEQEESWNVGIRSEVRPSNFSYNKVTQKPTVEEVLELVKKEKRWRGETLQRARRLLPCMLSNKVYTNHEVNRVLPQFEGGGDPYEYYSVCKKIEEENPLMRKKGSRYYSNISRLLIFYVAERLKAAGEGRGFDDHFYINFTTSRKFARKTKPEDRLPNGYEEGLLSYYSSEMLQDPPPPHLPPSPPPLPPLPPPPPVSSLSPPSYHVQNARTCKMIRPLVSFLKNGGKKRKVDYNRMSGQQVFDQIRFWANRTTEGRNHCREHAKLDPDGFHVDHVFPYVNGGPSHILNAYLMPPSANSHFSEWWTLEKKEYVGEEAVKAARKAMNWGKERADWNMLET